MFYNYEAKKMAILMKLWTTKVCKSIAFWHANMRRKTRSNDKLEISRYVFKIWNQYLQNGYVPRSCTVVNEQASSCIQKMLPSLDYKFGFTMLKFLLRCLA